MAHKLKKFQKIKRKGQRHKKNADQLMETQPVQKNTSQSYFNTLKNFAEHQAVKLAANVSNNLPSVGSSASYGHTLSSLTRGAILFAGNKLVQAETLIKYYAYNDTVSNSTLHFKYNVQNPFSDFIKTASIAADLITNCGLIEAPKVIGNFCSIASVTNYVSSKNETIYQFFKICDQANSTDLNNCVENTFNHAGDDTTLAVVGALIGAGIVIGGFIGCAYLGIVCYSNHQEAYRFPRVNFTPMLSTLDPTIVAPPFVRYRRDAFDDIDIITQASNENEYTVSSNPQSLFSRRPNSKLTALDEVVIESPSPM